MSELLYLMATSIITPNGNAREDPHGIFDNRDDAWSVIRNFLRVYAGKDYTPYCFHIYFCKRNACFGRHIILYWEEAVAAALNNRNPLPEEKE